MIWLKSTFTGFLAAIATIVAIVVATTTWHMSVGQGSGGVGVVSFVPSALLLFSAALAFAGVSLDVSLPTAPAGEINHVASPIATASLLPTEQT